MTEETQSKESLEVQRLTFALKDVIMLLIFIGGMIASYFVSQVAVASQMEQVASKVASQKLETVNLRLDGIERSQSNMNSKIDRLLEQLIERNDRRAGTAR